jgi:hypothetical protein
VKQQAIALPNWAEPRLNQVQVVEEITKAFDEVDLVVLVAPTGSGKTLIAEMVRQVMGWDAAYVCSSLTLQDQFMEDFRYAQLVKGRSNYDVGRGFTAADCTGQLCNLCDDGPPTCPYTVALNRAAGAPLVCANTTLALHHFMRKKIAKKLVVLDECDLLEGELLGFSELRITKKDAKRCGMEIPRSGTHMKTLSGWVKDWAGAASQVHPTDAKEARAWVGKIANASRVLEGKFVRETEQSGSLVLKPLSVVNGYKLLWNHGVKFLLMSGSVVSAGQLVKDAGWNGKWKKVSMEMTFPVENRPIFTGGGVAMSWKNRSICWPQMSRAVSKVLRETEDVGGNVLVHTASYALAEDLASMVGHTMGDEYKMLVYRNRHEREGVLREFMEGGKEGKRLVLFAPSMDRGVDFAGEKARVVVVAKVPFPSLGSKVVSERLHAPGGQVWYTVQTIRTILQMTGRGVRGESDWAHTYILDNAFADLYRRNRDLFPKWWRQAIRGRGGADGGI